jgi:hypothetical protein
MYDAFFLYLKYVQINLDINYVQGSRLSLLYDEEQNLDGVLPFDTMPFQLCARFSIVIVVWWRTKFR